MRGVARFVEDLLRSRRPRRFPASDEDAELVRTAIMLRAARQDSAAPRDDFAAGLHKRLAAEFGPPARAGAGSGRRAFVWAASVAAGTAAGAGIDHLLGARPPTAGSPRAAGTMVPDAGTWRTVAASADLPDGAVVPFDLGVLSGFVHRAGGRVRAVSGVCTHQGCRLTLAAAPGELVCPCHQAAFALDGTVLRHRLRITLAALPELAVRETGGAVQVFAPRGGAGS